MSSISPHYRSPKPRFWPGLALGMMLGFLCGGFFQIELLRLRFAAAALIQKATRETTAASPSKKQPVNSQEQDDDGLDEMILDMAKEPKKKKR